MAIAEIILYVFILALFFIVKVIKKPYRCYKRTIRHRYDTFDKKAASKPSWSIKAHYFLLIFLFIFSFIALSSLLTFIWSLFQKTFIFTDPKAIYIYMELSRDITKGIMVFIAIPLSNLILENLPFKTARFAARYFYNVPLIPHKLDIKLTLWMFIIIFAIGFPFVILNTDYYSYVKDDTICVNEFFSFSKNIYKLPGDIKYAEAAYKDYGFNFYYTIYFNDGESLEILNENRSEIEKVIQVDDILVKSNVTVNRSSFSSVEWNGIEDYYDNSLTKSLKELFTVGN